jgi:hypothetical protein
VRTAHIFAPAAAETTELQQQLRTVLDVVNQLPTTG